MDSFRAVLVKLRAERRIGEFSRELPKNERARTDLSAPHDGEQTKTSILADAGIIHPERYEMIASLPESEFEKHIAEVKQSNEELTRALCWVLWTGLQ